MRLYRSSQVCQITLMLASQGLGSDQPYHLVHRAVGSDIVDIRTF